MTNNHHGSLHGKLRILSKVHNTKVGRKRPYLYRESTPKMVPVDRASEKKRSEESAKDYAEYESAKATLKNDLQKIQAAREHVHKDQVQNVWGLYLYGLRHVLAIKDLSDAPDGILKAMDE